MDVLRADRRNAMLYIRGVYSFLDLSPLDDYDPDPACKDIISGSVLTKIEDWIRFHVFNIKTPKPANHQQALREYQITADKIGLAVAGVDKPLQASLKVAQAGANDIYVFTYDYGGCEGTAAQKVVTTIARFVEGRP